MNQRDIKELLQKIYKTKEDYTVVLSKKKNKRINGYYVLENRTIIINDGNFTDTTGNLHNSKLLYTAIHELTHHIIETEKGVSGRVAHTKQFWIVFHDLLDTAIQHGVYTPTIDSETKELITQGKQLSRAIADLQRELGAVLIALHGHCKEKDVRMEEIIERQLQLTQASSKQAIAAALLGDSGVGIDIQTHAARASKKKSTEIIKEGCAGKTVVQACGIPQLRRKYTPNSIHEKTNTYVTNSAIEKSAVSIKPAAHDALEVYNTLARPPEDALKTIETGKLIGKTEINPQWRYKAMTEQFGLVGIGWKYDIQKLWTEKVGKEVLAFAQIAVYVKNGEIWSEAIYGIGGSKLVEIRNGQVISNDDGYKMAVTDAFSTALKMIGVAADIYQGLWDGSKYIDSANDKQRVTENPQELESSPPHQENQSEYSLPQKPETGDIPALKGGQSTPEERQEINDILTKKYSNGEDVFSADEKIQYKNMRQEKTAQEVIMIAFEDMCNRLDAYHKKEVALEAKMVDQFDDYTQAYGDMSNPSSSMPFM